VEFAIYANEDLVNKAQQQATTNGN
jgi:hypothetical protein